jgi:hypothetical protein
VTRGLSDFADDLNGRADMARPFSCPQAGVAARSRAIAAPAAFQQSIVPEPLFVADQQHHIGRVGGRGAADDDI